MCTLYSSSRFHHFATFAIINSIEQWCFWKSWMAQLSAQQKTTTKQKKKDKKNQASQLCWIYELFCWVQVFCIQSLTKVSCQNNRWEQLKYWSNFFEKKSFFLKVWSTTCWEKVGADIFENCNQKSQEGAGSKNQCRDEDSLSQTLYKF